MREILFRGKRIDNGEWVYGNLCYLFDIEYNSQGYDDVPPRKHYIITSKQDFIEIDYNTIGQYTGLTDKNGVKIFEGDIIKFYSLKSYIQQSHIDISPEINDFYLHKNIGRVKFENCSYNVYDEYNKIFNLEYCGLESIEDIKCYIFGDNYKRIYHEEETQCDCNGNEINESVLGLEVITNIHNK